MRRGLTWLLAIPLLLVASQAAHAVAYRLAYPEAPVRLRALLASGHSYLDWLPLVLGLAGAVVVVSLAVAALDAAHGRAHRALPAWAFGLLPPVAFAVQEFLERSIHAGALQWHAAEAPTFLPGLALQLPFGLVAWLVARLLLRAAVRVGRSRAGRPPVPRSVAVAPLRPVAVALPRLRVLAGRRSERGPPLPAVV